MDEARSSANPWYIVNVNITLRKECMMIEDDKKYCEPQEGQVHPDNAVVEPSQITADFPPVPPTYVQAHAQVTQLQTSQTQSEITQPQPQITQPQPVQSYSTAHHATQQSCTQGYASSQYAASTQYSAPVQNAPGSPTPVQHSTVVPKKQHFHLKTFAAGFAGAGLAVLLGLGGFVGYNAISDNQTNDTYGSTTQAIQVQNENPSLAEAVAQKSLPAIASVNVYVHQQPKSIFNLFGVPSSADKDAPLVEASLGSGVVITQDGYILTNYHVVEGGAAYTVTVQEKEYEAEYVGGDPSSDIAILKVDAENMPAIEIGDSSSLEVGEWVMALGNPFGLENSVTTGIVSAIQRSSTMSNQDGTGMVIYPNMIQTDAAINPGNSGGALVDSEGKLIGINTMISSYSGSSSGVGFAIPVDYAMGLVNQILAGEEPTHAFLGVSMLSITPYDAKEMNFPVDNGVWVAEVYENSAAQKAGLEKGDIIVQLGSTSVAAAEDLALAVREYEPGDTVDMVIYRGDSKKTLTVTLDSDQVVHESDTNNSGESGNEWGYGSKKSLEDLGLGF